MQKIEQETEDLFIDPMFSAGKIHIDKYMEARRNKMRIFYADHHNQTISLECSIYRACPARFVRRFYSQEEIDKYNKELLEAKGYGEYYTNNV